MSVVETMPGSVAVVPGPGQVAGFGIDFSVVLSSCHPAGGLFEVEQRVAGTFFAQGIAFEMIAVCTGGDRCLHAGLEFTRILPAGALGPMTAVELARGAWVTVVDVAAAAVDPYELAEAFYRAREADRDAFAGYAAGVQDVLDNVALAAPQQ